MKLLNVKIQFAKSNDLLYDDANLRNVCDKNKIGSLKYYFPTDL